MDAKTLSIYADEEGHDDDFALCALAVTHEDLKDDLQDAWGKPIIGLDTDEDESELLLFVNSPEFEASGDMDDEGCVTLGDLRSFFSGQPDCADYSVCVSEKFVDGEVSIRVDNPVVGTGENLDRSRYFVIVRVSE